MVQLKDIVNKEKIIDWIFHPHLLFPRKLWLVETVMWFVFMWMVYLYLVFG